MAYLLLRPTCLLSEEKPPHGDGKVAIQIKVYINSSRLNNFGNSDLGNRQSNKKKSIRAELGKELFVERVDMPN